MTEKNPDDVDSFIEAIRSDGVSDEVAERVRAVVDEDYTFVVDWATFSAISLAQMEMANVLDDKTPDDEQSAYQMSNLVMQAMVEQSTDEPSFEVTLDGVEWTHAVAALEFANGLNQPMPMADLIHSIGSELTDQIEDEGCEEILELASVAAPDGHQFNPIAAFGTIEGIEDEIDMGSDAVSIDFD